MVQLLLALFLSSARADFLGFGGGESGAGKLSALIPQLEALEVKVDPLFEENFNKTIKSIEQSVEEEKLYCSGEAADAQGKTLSKEKKQLCMRELKKQYSEAVSMIYKMKKKYLGMIHAKQMDQLDEIQSKVKTDLDKNF
jgi:hypothetical protein